MHRVKLSIFKLIISFSICVITSLVLHSEGASSIQHVVKTTYIDREKRDIDILAECDLQCLPEKDIKDYDLLLTYDNEDPEEIDSSSYLYPDIYSSGHAEKSCAYACKILDMNKTDSTENSPILEITTKQIEEFTETESFSVTTKPIKYDSHTTSLVSIKIPISTDQSRINIATTSVHTEGSQYIELSTISNLERNIDNLTTTSSNFQRHSTVPSKISTMVVSDDTVGLNPTYETSSKSHSEDLAPRQLYLSKNESNESNLTQQFSLNMIKTSTTQLPPVRVIPKVIRLTVLEAEMMEAGIKPLKSTVLQPVPIETKARVLYVINTSTAKPLDTDYTFNTKEITTVDSESLLDKSIHGEGNTKDPHTYIQHDVSTETYQSHKLQSSLIASQPNVNISTNISSYEHIVLNETKKQQAKLHMTEKNENTSDIDATTRPPMKSSTNTEPTIESTTQNITSVSSKILLETSVTKANSYVDYRESNTHIEGNADYDIISSAALPNVENTDTKIEAKTNTAYMKLSTSKMSDSNVATNSEPSNEITIHSFKHELPTDTTTQDTASANVVQPEINYETLLQETAREASAFQPITSENLHSSSYSKESHINMTTSISQDYVLTSSSFPTELSTTSSQVHLALRDIQFSTNKVNSSNFNLESSTESESQIVEPGDKIVPAVMSESILEQYLQTYKDHNSVNITMKMNELNESIQYIADKLSRFENKLNETLAKSYHTFKNLKIKDVNKVEDDSEVIKNRIQQSIPFFANISLTMLKFPTESNTVANFTEELFYLTPEKSSTTTNKFEGEFNTIENIGKINGSSISNINYNVEYTTAFSLFSNPDAITATENDIIHNATENLIDDYSYQSTLIESTSESSFYISDSSAASEAIFETNSSSIKPMALTNEDTLKSNLTTFTFSENFTEGNDSSLPIEFQETLLERLKTLHHSTKVILNPQKYERGLITSLQKVEHNIINNTSNTDVNNVTDATEIGNYLSTVPIS